MLWTKSQNCACNHERIHLQWQTVRLIGVIVAEMQTAYSARVVQASSLSATDAFSVTVYDQSGARINQSAIGNRYLFQCREYSYSTGLYNFRARYYDPETGRWLSKDPIGISGGLNQYVFCGNNPVNYVDPWGLWWWDADIIEWGVGGMLGFHGSDVAGAAWSGAGKGALEGNAAFWDGVIPFWDPFKDQYMDSCGNTVDGTGASKWIGARTRDIEISLAYGFARTPSQLTHFTTEAGAAGISESGVINGGGGLFGKGVYMTSVGRPINPFVPLGSDVPIKVVTPAWTARIIPKFVYIKWGSGVTLP